MNDPKFWLAAAKRAKPATDQSALRNAVIAGEIAMPTGPDARRDLARRLVDTLDDAAIYQMLGAVIAKPLGKPTRTGEPSIRFNFRHTKREREAWSKRVRPGEKLADWARRTFDERCAERPGERRHSDFAAGADDTLSLRCSETERARWDAEALAEGYQDKHGDPLTGQWARNALNVAAGL